VQVTCGAVLAGITQSGPGVVLPAVGVFDAVVLLTPAVAVVITVAGVVALTAAAGAAGGPAVAAVAGYTFALAAALLLGFNRRQYMARVEQGDLLLAQAERARREQARAATLEERTRIAREIHDVLAHSLGALAVQLDVTEALLDNGADTTVLRAHVARARRLAVDGLTEARRAVTALREDTPPLPVLLDGLLAQYRADSGALPGCRSPERRGRCRRTPRWPRSAPPRRRSATPANTPRTPRSPWIWPTRTTRPRSPSPTPHPPTARRSHPRSRRRSRRWRAPAAGTA
jgi:hypothetical protein